ncbi:MAG: RNA polymerase sigma factor [Flavobacteriaceae bacterium]|nr:RNA polymerase sigma factor [Flavobacteriaceae bacterium]
MSDNEIVKKSITNIEYFSCLYNRYEATLLRYVKRMALVDDDQAEDILQEAFIKIWRNLNDFNQDLKLSSWIYRIVHNEAISFWRKKKSFGKDRQIILKDNLLEDIPIDFEIVDGHRKNDLLTHEILELLPLKYKSVLVLKFIERMSYQEISDVLKIPEGTVAARINRAKKKIIEETSKKYIPFKK